MFRKLLDGHLLCEPMWRRGKPGYRFTTTGTLDCLLMAVNSCPTNLVEGTQTHHRWPQCFALNYTALRMPPKPFCMLLHASSCLQILIERSLAHHTPPGLSPVAG